jgi:hypothetical protein
MHDHELTSQRSSGPIRVWELEAEFPPNQPKEYRVQAAPLVLDTFSHHRLCVMRIGGQR